MRGAIIIKIIDIDEKLKKQCIYTYIKTLLSKKKNVVKKKKKKLMKRERGGT
jgi:hypothetical protein